MKSYRLVKRRYLPAWAKTHIILNEAEGERLTACGFWGNLPELVDEGKPSCLRCQSYAKRLEAAQLLDQTGAQWAS